MNSPFGDVFNNGSVRLAVIGVLAILSLYLLAQTISTAGTLGRAGVPATDTITVQGTGEATLAPDVARISFTVENSTATVAEAQEATTKQTNAALDFVKEQGVLEKDVKTLSYSISPKYSYPNPCTLGAYCPDYSREPKITGYRVSQTIQVTVRDLELVGDILSGLGTLEVQNVNGPSFALDDETAGQDAARADAINKAKTQAMLLAKQLGVSLGKVVSFNESSGGYPYPLAYGLSGDMAFAKSEAAPQIPAGENTYTTSVSITYEIR